MKTFKILGLLMAYPEPELITHLDELEAVLTEEKLLSGKLQKEVSALIAKLAVTDIFQLQEDYVECFDRGRAHCLHLFEHVYGESRDRGQAMVDLAEMYAQKGLFVQSGELPDYLPLFLEYLSLLPLAEARELLGEPIDVIATIGGRLARQASPYAVLFRVLESLSRTRSDSRKVRSALQSGKEDKSFEALDQAWEEPEAFPSGDCSQCDLAVNGHAQTGGNHHG